jgi:hypothetical protein
VRSSASLESFHQLITEVIARHRAKAA